MKHKIVLFLILTTTLFNLSSYSQRVGVVLSGGGATGLAHVGVLIALEEAEIPVDYITGTSAGALIGAMYASGISPKEIKAYILSDKFMKMASGELEKEKKFFLRQRDPNASMLEISFSKDSIFKKFLPTNFITPSLLDYEMFRILGVTGASVDKDFDSLFIPFRCVASDVTSKQSVVFSEGDLNAAVRASMTYPFYVNPIRIDGKLLFDGGLYNNFPSDVLYDNFPVDYIIGSNVSFNADAPTEDNLLSQITNMLMKPTDFTLPCAQGVIITPSMDINTFDFSDAERAIQIGYDAAQPFIDSIKADVIRRKSFEEISLERKSFRKKVIPLKINEISTGLDKSGNNSFIRSSFMKDSLRRPLGNELFVKRYFRAYSSPQIKYIYPTVKKSSDSTFSLHLDITKEKPFEFRVGGHFSSRPVNTAYIGLSYYDLGKGAVGIHGESYFGKFYSSTRVHLNYDFPSLPPFRATPYFTLNRWDYFRSFSTFFEDIKPSFLVQKELYYGLKLALPVDNNSAVAIDFRAFDNEDEYYQTLSFSSSDTADITQFEGHSAIFSYEYNSLNKKQWASEGSSIKLNFRYVQGKEQSLSGTTTQQDYDLRKFHQWINLSVEANRYFKLNRSFRIGIYGKTVFNSQSLFSNYTASILATTAFAPLPDSRTFFMPEYRAPQYAGAGLNLVFTYKNLLDFRFDPYFFQPFKQIVRLNNDDFSYSDTFTPGTFMVGASVIFHSILGPIRLSTNYFPEQSKPFITQLSFGYVLFNDRAIR
ncbi:MAG: patatin-like phospholipase family protein [Brumimicrobium sp.]|nr:patatin-like phospholipase family protein [Brumimicrobium sp.]